MSQLSWPTPPVPATCLRWCATSSSCRTWPAATSRARVQEKGGWDALQGRLERSPRASMEQVLHPEKFFAHEAPREVSIRYAPPRGQGWAKACWGSSSRAPSSPRAPRRTPRPPAGAPAPPTIDEVERAAAGWGGDAYKAWDVGGRTLLVWRTEWDRREDAREFEQTVLRRLERTHGARKRLEGAALFARAGWLMAVAASGDAVTIVSSNDPALLPVALKSVGGS